MDWGGILLFLGLAIGVGFAWGRSSAERSRARFDAQRAWDNRQKHRDG